jgi:hypothetical protein
MTGTQNHHQADSHHPSTTCWDVLRQAWKLITEEKYQKALDLLNTKGAADKTHQNVKGVCLMRLGRHDDAVRVYRSLVMAPGSTWMHPEAPLSHKINFATALLLSGNPSGCLEVLGEIHQDQDPRIQRIHACIQKWVAGLTWFQKLNWWLGHIEPANRPVTIDFEPGDLSLERQQLDSPTPGNLPPSRRTAA